VSPCDKTFLIRVIKTVVRLSYVLRDTFTFIYRIPSSLTKLMPVHGFTNDIDSRPKSTVGVFDDPFAATEKESVTLEEKVTGLFEALRRSIFLYLTAVFGRSQAAEAEDITQEAFLLLYRLLREGQHIDNARAWLFKVAHNLAVNRLKAQQFVAPLDDLTWEEICRRLPDPGLNPEQRALKLEDFARLHEAMKRLSSQERQCLHLRAEGFRYREIAEILEIATPTVGEFLRRGIKKLSERNGD